MGDDKTVLGLTKFEKTLVVILPIILGGLIGWFIPVIVDWVLTLPIVPMEKLFLLIASFNSMWVSIVAALIGIIVGIMLTFIFFDYYLEVMIYVNIFHFRLGI